MIIRNPLTKLEASCQCTFGVFDLIQVLTGGGPASSTESIALYAYWNALRFLDFGYSSTIIMASFMLISLICVFAWMFLQILIPTHSKSRGAIES